MTTPEVFGSGMLDVGDGHRVYWEQRGNPSGKPVVCLHGGPGSGCSPGWSRWFDGRFRVVLLDQRGCGRSTPSAADDPAALDANTTHHLVADLERLREHLGIDRWMIFGASWGTTLGLAYAVAHPARVTEAVLFSVVTTSRREVEWVTRDMGRVFPQAWEAFRDGVPPAARDGSLVDAYAELLASDSAAVREKAARDWCTWEDTHVAVQAGHRPDPRYDDPRFRMTFARLVTHYWRHAAWLPDGALRRGVEGLGDIPAELITGRMDVSGPPDIAWHLSRAWPGSSLVLVDDAGHGAGYPGMTEAVSAAVERFAP
jgi:proline iminopeptidase